MTTILGLTLYLNDSEINVAVRTILCPTDNLTSRGTRKIKIVQNLIQEEVTTGLKLVICKCLLCLKEHAVVIEAMNPDSLSTNCTHDATTGIASRNASIRNSGVSQSSND